MVNLELYHLVLTFKPVNKLLRCDYFADKDNVCPKLLLYLPLVHIIQVIFNKLLRIDLSEFPFSAQNNYHMTRTALLALSLENHR